MKRKIKGKSYTCQNCGAVWEPGQPNYHRAKGMLTASLHERCPKCISVKWRGDDELR